MLKPGTPTVHVGMEAVKGPATIGLYHPGVGAGQVFSIFYRCQKQPWLTINNGLSMPNHFREWTLNSDWIKDHQIIFDMVNIYSPTYKTMTSNNINQIIFASVQFETPSYICRLHYLNWYSIRIKWDENLPK